ncbi:MAG: DUF2959 family protein [Planctomycetota bacterium]
MPKSTSLPWLAAVAIPALLVGCATTGYRQAETTASAMDSLRENLNRIEGDLAGVQDSLNHTLEPSGDGTVVAFRDFESRLQDLRMRFSAVEGNVQDIKSRGRVYFESWQREIALIQDEEIRNGAIDRREALMSAQDELVRAMELTRPGSESLLRSLEDLRVYFSNDLSSAGIDAVRGSVRRIVDTTVSLQSRLEEVRALIESTSPGFTPAVAATPVAP